MKKILALTIIGGLFAGMLACKRGEILGDPASLTVGSYLTLTKLINNQIDYSQRNSATVSIEVTGVGAPIAKVNIYVVPGADLNKANWKYVKSVDYSDGVTLEVTSTEMAAALGISVDDYQPGTSYTLYNEIELEDGRVFSMENTTTDFESQAPYNMAMQWKVFIVCPFDAATSAGNYHVVYDGDWQDFNVGDPITVTAGPGPNQVSMLAYPSPAFGSNRKAIVIDVDPASGAATIAPQIFGDYPGAPDCSIQGSGYVFSCTGLITLTNTITYGGSDYAGLKFIISK